MEVSEVLAEVPLLQMKNVPLDFVHLVTVYEMDVVFVNEVDVGRLVHQVLDVVLLVLHEDWEIPHAVQLVRAQIAVDNATVTVNVKGYEAETDDVDEG